MVRSPVPELDHASMAKRSHWLAAERTGRDLCEKSNGCFTPLQGWSTDQPEEISEAIGGDIVSKSLWPRTTMLLSMVPSNSTKAQDLYADVRSSSAFPIPPKTMPFPQARPWGDGSPPPQSDAAEDQAITNRTAVEKTKFRTRPSWQVDGRRESRKPPRLPAWLTLFFRCNLFIFCFCPLQYSN